MVLLALPPCDDAITEPMVFGTISVTQRDVDPAGDAYELYLMKRLGLLNDPESEEEADKDEGDEENVNKEKLNEKRKKANKNEALKTLIFKNHYQALGLEHIYFDATLEDVRKAYKSKVLTHHPDKFEEGEYEGIAKQQWLAVIEV